MSLDWSRLRRGEVIVGAGGLVLLVSTFLLSWYNLKLGTGPAGSRIFIKTPVDGWNGLTHGHWLVLLTILLAFALVFLQAWRPAPAWPMSASVAVTIVAGVTSLWLIYRVIISTPGDRKFGALLGLVSALFIVYGGYDSMRQEGIASDDAPKDIPTVSLKDQPGT
jgi:hypothetical protein